MPPLNSPLGDPVCFAPVPCPGRDTLRGHYVVIRPLEADRDVEALHAASHPPDGDPGIWTYLFEGPYADAEQMRDDLAQAERSADPLYFTLARRPHERPSGVASYLRITPEHGVIEVGHIWFGVAMRRSAAATEAIYLLARHAFDDLGYRRLEWKCNALNAASRRAAERFGFSFEGVFRKHLVIKGRNRDTAWYSIVDDEWPALRAAFEQWLDPGNFDSSGCQRRRLEELRLTP